jgi:hypothetical protein
LKIIQRKNFVSHAVSTRRTNINLRADIGTGLIQHYTG